jgi:hypothetical protein
MSWHYLQEQGEESSEACCSGGAPLQPLRSKTTHGEFYSNGKLTESYIDSLSGTTLPHSTDIPGAEKSMSSAVDSPVRTSAAPGKVQALLDLEAAYGERWHASLAKFNPDSSSWKTHQCSLLGDWEPFSETWPKWGMMQNGECSERVMPVRHTSETESGSWPTPTVCGNHNRKGASATSGDGLATAVVARMWPTPNQRDWKDTGATQGNRKSPNLGTMVHQSFAPPQARDFRTGSTDRWENPERTRNLNDQIGGQLNPNWVEWLMGWPIGWTDLNPLGMDKFQQWLNSHSIFSKTK